MSTAASTEERSGETSSSDSGHRGHRSLSQEAFEDRLRQRRKGRPTQHSAAVAAVPDASQVRSGLEVGLLNELLEQLGLSQEAFARMMGVSVHTLQRRRAESGGRLTPAESDRLWHLLLGTTRSSWDHALGALGSADAARAWLTEAKAVLGGESPAERLDTEPGLREVEDMLTVLDETGVA